MSKLMSYIAFVLCLWVGGMEALTSGIAIPCYFKHFRYLGTLIESLAGQTRLPDEVVVSLSQVEELAEEEIAALEAGPWPFKVKVVRRQGVFMEGANRTMAAKTCCSDIVLCIDADDIPHPQRVEAVMSLFEQTPSALLVLCGHAYCPGEAIVCEASIPFFTPNEYEAQRWDLKSVRWKRLKSAEDLTLWSSGIHNGSPSLRRVLLDHEGILWTDRKDGADLEFNSLVLNTFGQTYLIQLPLIHYFNGRSSGHDIGR